MKKRFSEEHIIGFLSEAGAGLPIKSYAVGTASQKLVTSYGAASLAV